jgi:RNA polymerase sigma factor (sigma-70 family)
MSSFEVWYRRYHPALVAALTVVAGDRDAALDAADEAYVRALERWTRVSSMASPEGWAYRVGVNTLHRRAGRRRLERRAATGRLAATVIPDLRPEVWDAVRALAPRQREAVALRYVLDMSEAQVAAVMRVAVGTASATLASATVRLAALLSTPEREVAL